MPKKKKNKVEVVSPTEELALANPEAFKDLIKQSMPGFVKEVEKVEDLGTAMMQAGQEMMLAVDDVLVRYFNFTDTEVKSFHKHLVPILKGVEEYEKHGISALSPHTMSIIGDIAQHRYNKERFARTGLEQPLLEGAKPFLKQLEKVNKGKA